MHFIEEECMQLLLNWDDFNYSLPEDCLADISTLGPTLRDESYSSKRAVELPCRIVLKTGSVIDPALIIFCTMPPVRSFGAGINFLSMASEITASDFALPKEIRFATRLAEWMCKSPEPVYARSTNGTFFEFTDERDFFQHPTVRAKELRLAPSGSLGNEHYEEPPPTLFVAKWTEQIEEILLQPFREFEINYKPST